MVTWRKWADWLEKYLSKNLFTTEYKALGMDIYIYMYISHILEM